MFFFFSSRRRHTRYWRDWSSDVCSSDLFEIKGSGMRMGGGAKPFGVDAARVPSLVRRLIDGGAEWRGFHIFAGSQALAARSEERRVGKECRSRWSPYH